MDRFRVCWCIEGGIRSLVMRGWRALMDGLAARSDGGRSIADGDVLRNFGDGRVELGSHSARRRAGASQPASQIGAAFVVPTFTALYPYDILPLTKFLAPPSSRASTFSFVPAFLPPGRHFYVNGERQVKGHTQFGRYRVRGLLRLHRQSDRRGSKSTVPASQWLPT